MRVYYACLFITITYPVSVNMQPLPLNNGLSQLEIEQYWQNLLQLPPAQMFKTAANNTPKSSQQKGRKLLYGMCAINVNSVRYAQHIFGAIQEYIGIDKPEWLDC
jgi:hypothetical protein